MPATKMLLFVLPLEIMSKSASVNDHRDYLALLAIERVRTQTRAQQLVHV